MKIEVKLEDVQKYLGTAEKVSFETFKEKVNRKEKNSEYWRGRWDSYKELCFWMVGRNDQREGLRLNKAS